MVLSSLKPRSRLVVELVFVLIFAAPSFILLWPADRSVQSLLWGILPLYILGSLSLIPVARYGRAIGKPFFFDKILDVFPPSRGEGPSSGSR